MNVTDILSAVPVAEKVAFLSDNTAAWNKNFYALTIRHKVAEAIGDAKQMKELEERMAEALKVLEVLGEERAALANSNGNGTGG